ncbi:hypothetical protein BKA82DRAFT_4349114 [Pisolithus tinctorius]|nr:hypothetical protein BKA82DRAFT_4349114 [Pisolithus tinctorius]
MASSQFQASTIQPIYPVKMFPVSFRLVKGSSAIPHAGGMRERQGTIYLAPNDMYIFGRSGWVRWDPKDALHLTVAGDECMVAPCPINGIRLLANDTSYPHYLTSMEVELRRIGFQHPPTNADILRLVGMQFSDPKSKSQDLEKQGEGVIGGARKPPAEATVPMQEAGSRLRKRKARDVGGTGSRKLDDEEVKGAPIASTSASRKGKGKEVLKPEGHCTTNEKKRQRTEDAETHR